MGYGLCDNMHYPDREGFDVSIKFLRLVNQSVWNTKAGNSSRHNKTDLKGLLIRTSIYNTRGAIIVATPEKK